MAREDKRRFPDEILRNPDGSLDEIVADNITVHLEQMDDDFWWLALIREKGALHVCFSLDKKKRHLVVDVTQDEIGFLDHVTDMPNMRELD